MCKQCLILGMFAILFYNITLVTYKIYINFNTLMQFISVSSRPVGALINAGSTDGDVYPCETLAQFDMTWTPTREHAYLVDEDAKKYLGETLENFRNVSSY
jgi:hypothetical protein